MEPSRLFPPREQDDQSTHGHRQLIGWTGLLLPGLVWVMSGWRPTAGLPRWDLLDSISAYYYTGAVAVFVGTLGALAAFLITYRGYSNRLGWLDRTAAVAASLAALGVAFFPTGAPDGVAEPSWWLPRMRTVHYASAVVLFSSFAFFALFLFPQRGERADRSGEPLSSGKRLRNVVYRTSGAIILLSMAWAAVASWRDASIYWPESAALVAFASAWLVKGRAGWTLASVAKNAVYYGRRPGEAVRAMRGRR
jgi:hypothetical protein